MKKDLVALIFKTTNQAKELNIGDTVLLSHENEEYVLGDGTNLYGYQTEEVTSELDSLLNYVCEQRKAKLILWDNTPNLFLINSPIVEVAAVTKNNIVIIPSDYVQEKLLEEIKNQKEALAEDFEQFILDTLFDEKQEIAVCDCSECCGPSEQVCDSTEQKEEKKEETGMFSGLGSSFGKINSEQFKLSINGLAVRGKDGKYVTFNPETRELVEVTTGFFDDMKDLLFLMPATELEVGDTILHQNKPYYITKVTENSVKGIDFEEAVENTIIPKTNVFGMKYYTKVFNCLGTNNILGSDIASNPMMAYALMGGKDFDLSKVMMFQALGNQGKEKGVADFSENPIMLMALMSNENGGGDLGNFAKMQILSQIAGNKKKEKKVTKEN